MLRFVFIQMTRRVAEREINFQKPWLLYVRCTFYAHIQSTTYANSLFQTLKEKKKTYSLVTQSSADFFFRCFSFLFAFVRNLCGGCCCYLSDIGIPVRGYWFQKITCVHLHSHESKSKAAILIGGKWKSRKNRTENTMNGNHSVMLLTSFCTQCAHIHSHSQNDFFKTISLSPPKSASRHWTWARSSKKSIQSEFHWLCYVLAGEMEFDWCFAWFLRKSCFSMHNKDLPIDEWCTMPMRMNG